ncbi:MAG: ferrous iron transporter B [Syntrophomonadaceae bacterium]|nr:ferrous iron transporter B [Syntrophomonadaceae bacterium]
MAIALVGQPNVGKSSVLSRLTGVNTVVSNYPGTSLELERGELTIEGRKYEIIDTPGIYSLALAQNEETIVPELLFDPAVDLVIDVIDAANLARNLVLTLELVDLDKPMIVLLNQIDRVRAGGYWIDHQALSRMLGCPVFPFSALTGEGVMEVLNLLQASSKRGFSRFRPHQDIAGQITCVVGSDCTGKCLRCLSQNRETGCFDKALWARHERARTLAERVLIKQTAAQVLWLTRVEKFIDKPWQGSLVLLGLVLLGFKALLSFTGWMEGLVANTFAPVQEILSRGIGMVVPPGFWNQVLSKGVPEGILLPFALVMPAMLMVSLLMSLLEDTGLLARYAVVMERFGGLFGVSGQAVIPLALGFGCRTPAIVATRILPGTGQRFIVMTLLSIVIPCAATVGMITSVISSFHAYASVIIVTTLVVFVVLGRLMKSRYGEKSELVYELPPLRIPLGCNLWSKVKTRCTGFLTEVLPLLVIMSVGVRIVIDSGVLERLHALEELTRFLFGIPAEAFAAVLVTVVQRYLAPLILLNLTLSPREATIAISMVALSLPCLPVMVMIWREAGVKTLGKIMGMGFLVSFAIGILLNLLLPC